MPSRPHRRPPTDEERRVLEERRLRRAAVTAATHQASPSDDEPPDHDDAAAEDDSLHQRTEQQALWVDAQVRNAIERGDFDNLPGAGKPLRGLDGRHDPDWWVKGLIEREQLTGVLPPALALRKEDAELDAALDREGTEAAVRRTVIDFNRRVVDARRQLQGGPPVVTPTRDVDAEVEAWRDRRAERVRRQREQLAATADAAATGRRRRWWRRRPR